MLNRYETYSYLLKETFMKKIFYLLFLIIVVCFTLAAQSLTTVILPQYIEGINPTNINRIPFAYRVRITGLTASATYHYFNQIVLSTDGASKNGGGNCIYVSTTGDFIRTTSPDISTAGAYGTFAADGTGTYEGWFITEPTGSGKLVPGKYIFMRIMLNDGAGGTTVATRITTADSVRVVKLDPTVTDSTGTGLRCTSSGSAKDFVFAYDNTTGSGRPISGSFIESDGTDNSTTNSYTAFYSNNVNGVSGAFGMILPNVLPNGIRCIQEYSLTTGAVVTSATDIDGVWPSSANTINPSGGTTEIVLAGTDLLSYSLTVNFSHGTVTKTPDQQNYQFGSSVQLKENPESAYHFVTWSGDVPTGHETDTLLTVIMDQNRTITAYFALITYSPTLSLPTATNITSTTAVLGSKIISNGNDPITERGVVWSTSPNPTTADHKLIALDTNEIYIVPIGSLPSGTFIHFRGYAINGFGTGYSPDATFYTLSLEPSTSASSFSAITVSANQINLSWDAATGASGYIILQRIGVDPTAVPKDITSYAVGDSIGDGKVAALIPSGATSMSITGLTGLTSYHYSIFPYAWDGLNINTCNYKTDTIPTANAKTLKEAEFTSVILPQYMEGINWQKNSNRVPFAYRARLTGLLTNTTYRFVNQIALSTEPDSINGAGNCIFASTAGDFVRTSTPSFDSTGSYGIFKTDSSGGYEGWFITEPTGNFRFVPGKYVFMRIWLNDGMSGTAVIKHLTMLDSVRVVKLDPSVTDSTGTGLSCTSAANPKDFVFIYDNKAGTDRPISGSFIENDGTDNSIANNYAAFYVNHVNGINGSFGVVLPNRLPNGVRRVERRSLATGALVVFATDADGVWPSGVNTINPFGGTTDLVLSGTDVQWTTSVEKISPILSEYTLFQNFPNPFNPSTTIKYQLSQTSYVTLQVYDILGRVVTTLVHETKQAGFYSMEFNAASLSSGIYFYKLTAGTFTQTRYMMLVK